jgi:hypothetical protein
MRKIGGRKIEPKALPLMHSPFASPRNLTKYDVTKQKEILINLFILTVF